MEQDVENLQKKLNGCLRENQNLQEELAEAYRVKVCYFSLCTIVFISAFIFSVFSFRGLLKFQSQLAELHGAELSKVSYFDPKKHWLFCLV